VARREILGEMPETLDEFMAMAKADDIPMNALLELGAARKCCRCGEEIVNPSEAAEVILDHYDATDSNVDLESLFIESQYAASADFSDACQWCGHQMSKDD
jgi:DNA-directed RNA polymerase subunit N (RpoN/RPB10)